MPGSCVEMYPVAPSTPDGRQHTKVVVVTKIDAHMAYVPEVLIHFVLKVGSSYSSSY